MNSILNSKNNIRASLSLSGFILPGSIFLRGSDIRNPDAATEFAVKCQVRTFVLCSDLANLITKVALKQQVQPRLFDSGRLTGLNSYGLLWYFIWMGYNCRSPPFCGDAEQYVILYLLSLLIFIPYVVPHCRSLYGPLFLGGKYCEAFGEGEGGNLWPRKTATIIQVTRES